MKDNVLDFVDPKDHNKFVNYTHLTENERRYLNGENVRLSESELLRLEERELV